MANANIVQGFQPLRNLNTADNNMQVIACTASDATAIFNGDAVKLTGGCDSAGRTLVTQAAAGDAVFGIVVGFSADGAALDVNYRKASDTSKIIYVNVDPNTVYIIQNATATALTDGMKNFDVTVGAGSTTTGMSGMTVNNGTIATTNTLKFKFLGFYNDLNNTPNAAYNKLLCKINGSQLANQIAGV